MKRLLGIIFILISTVFLLECASLISPIKNDHVVWERTFGSQGTNWGSYVFQSDTGYLVFGHTESSSGRKGKVWIISYDLNGELKWEKTIRSGSQIYPAIVRRTYNGGYVIGGSIVQNGEKSKAWLAELNEDFEIKWEKVYGSENRSNGVRDIIQTDDRNFLLSGKTTFIPREGDFSCDNLSLPYEDPWVMKVGSNGNKIWERNFKGKGYADAKGVIQTSDGGYVVVGANSLASKDSGKAWIIKLDQKGNTIWEKNFGGQYDDFNAVTSSSSGEIVVLGNKHSDDSENFSRAVWIINMDNDGTVNWETKFCCDKSCGCMPMTIQRTNDNGYILAGWIYWETWDSWVAKLDRSGKVQWKKVSYLGEFQRIINHITQTKDGGYIFTGAQSHDLEGSEVEAWIGKIDAKGNIH